MLQSYEVRQTLFRFVLCGFQESIMGGLGNVMKVIVDIKTAFP